MELNRAILDSLPYREPFLFVDRLEEVSEQGAQGYYRFREDAYFYAGHFPEEPVTPGVILTETMAQIGLVCLGIYLTGAYQKKEPLHFVFTESQTFFLKKVSPGEGVQVRSEKIYFRLGKLKCKVEMHNEAGERVCYGTLAGMILKERQL